MQYDYEQLIGMIASNNLTAIYANLVQQGRVTAMSAPSVDALGYAITEQLEKLPTEQFFAWLENLLDVPLDQSGLHYPELTNLRHSTGRSPAKVLVDQMREQLPAAEPTGVAAMFGSPTRMTWFSWLLLLLAIVGAVCVLRFAARIVAKITD